MVGYHDATSADDAAIQAAGGYWIIKNSWGPAGGITAAMASSPTTSIDMRADFYTGPAYYTGAMATATWQGSGGIWAAGGSNWTSSGSAYTWVNQETAAVFNASANNNITISGPAIAHALTFNTGATGYTFLRRHAHGHRRRHHGQRERHDQFARHDRRPADLDHGRRQDAHRQRQREHDHQHADRGRGRRHDDQRRHRRRRARCWASAAG